MYAVHIVRRTECDNLIRRTTKVFVFEKLTKFRNFQFGQFDVDLSKICVSNVCRLSYIYMKYVPVYVYVCLPSRVRCKINKMKFLPVKMDFRWASTTYNFKQFHYGFQPIVLHNFKWTEEKKNGEGERLQCFTKVCDQSFILIYLYESFDKTTRNRTFIQFQVTIENLFWKAKT